MLDPGQQQAAHYSAFISYSRHDSRLARWLQSALESYRMPRRLVGTPTPRGPVADRFQPVFLDLSELTVAPDLLDELSAALGASQYLIVLCTPRAAASEWVNREIRLMQQQSRGDHILAALFEGDEHESFPPALLNAEGNRQPLAADFRPEGDGRRLALLKLVAAMSGVGLGELVHREEGRRIRRLSVLAAASLAGMLAFGGISFYALNARAQAEAERRKSEAMVNSLVTDLRGAVKPVGNLSMLERVNDAAVSYFRGQSLQNMPDAALATRARLLTAMGEDEATRGNMATARSHFQEAARTTAARLAVDPHDPQRIYDHAQVEYWLGHYAWSAGNPTDARRAWSEYERLARELVQRQPEDPRWHLEAGYAQSNIGVLDLRQNLNVTRAEARFGAALRQYQAALKLDPTNLTARSDVSDGLAWLSDSQRVAGKLAAARQTREQQAKLLRATLAHAPDDLELRKMLVVNEIAFGRIAAAAGERSEALRRFRTARTMAATLAEADRDSAVLKATSRMATIWEAHAQQVAARHSRQAPPAVPPCLRTSPEDAGAEAEDWCRLLHARHALLAGDRAQARHMTEDVAAARLKPGAPRLSARFGLDYAQEIQDLEQLMATEKTGEGDGKGEGIQKGEG